MKQDTSFNFERQQPLRPRYRKIIDHKKAPTQSSINRTIGFWFKYFIERYDGCPLLKQSVRFIDCITSIFYQPVNQNEYE
jgi:hypothetical protein